MTENMEKTIIRLESEIAELREKIKDAKSNDQTKKAQVYIGRLIRKLGVLQFIKEGEA